MIQEARIKLTLLYSIIFLLLFWSLSLGIYFWMNQFFGDQGSIQFIQLYQHSPVILPTHRHETPSDVVMDNLRSILLLIDGLLLIIIPVVTWFLTGNALKPVQTAHKREQQFLADASHELRTPLSILSAEMEVTLKKKQTISDYEKSIRSNKEEVEELIALVENLLFMSREQTKLSSPINETIDLTDVLAERIASFTVKAEQKKLKISFQPPETETLIAGNPQLVKRLFTNLLDNAIKYTAKGTVSVAVKREKNLVSITVSDTGVGIDAPHQEKIFDRFYRVDESRSAKGYGLGLAIAKQIVVLHQGKIEVKSTVGKGTTVQVSFPIKDLIKQVPEKNLS